MSENVIQLEPIAQFKDFRDNLVLIYKFKTQLTRVYVVTYDDGTNEVPWGCSFDLWLAMKEAAKEWSKVTQSQINPFEDLLYSPSFKELVTEEEKKDEWGEDIRDKNARQKDYTKSTNTVTKNGWHENALLIAVY